MNSRKIILLSIVFQLFYTLAAAQVKLVGNITTNGVANYPTHIDSLSKGGYMSMPTIAARNAIPTLRRKYGMLVFVEADGIIYKLNAATLANTDWVTFSLGATTDVDAGTLTGTTLNATVTGSSLTSVGTLANLTVTNPIAGSITGNAATATLATTATTATTAENITATSNTTLTTLSSLTTVGTLSAGAVPYSLLTGTAPTFNQNTTGNAATATTATTAGTATTTTGNAGTATKLATAITINGVAFDGSENINITASSDAGTLTGTTLNSTVTGSSLTSVGTLVDLTVTNPIAGSITGNAATATTATNATTATTAGNITATSNTTLTSLSNLTSIGTLSAGAVPYSLLTGTVPTFNQNTTGNAATATTATTAGTATTTTGNAGTATKLATARTINGVAFDGSANINITASSDAGTLTGTTLNATVTGSSLTSVGTLANLTVTNPISGSVTGNAATATLATTATTATTAGNITATSNTTLTSLSNLATVGTITSGVWDGTSIKITKGGTGLTASGTAGQVLTSTGSGTLTWTSTSAATTHTIGESYGGGKVFYVTTDRLHGLIAETQDQSTACTWYNAQDIISNSANHSVEGKLFTDWRLPTKYELNLMFVNRSSIGGFASSAYWSSTEYSGNFAWDHYFVDGVQYSNNKTNTYYVRAIRAF